MSASRMLGIPFTVAVLCAVGTMPGSVAFAQPATSCAVDWSYSSRYDSGSRPTIAMAPNGYFIEAHNSAHSGKMSYIFGRQPFAAPLRGPNRDYGDGSDPSVSLRADGLVFDVHFHPAGLSESRDTLFYRAGKVDLHGDVVTGVIHWADAESVGYDTGVRPSVSVNSKGDIVEVHEGNSILSRHDLFYNVGYVRVIDGKPIVQLSGRGIKYSSGSQPHISIDDSGNILEIHSSGTDNGVHYLHYLRGVISSQYRQIDFAPAASNSRFVDKLAQNPGLSLINSGLISSGRVLEVHQGVGADDRHLYDMFGQLDTTTNNYVAWSVVRAFRVGTTPQVATNGRVALAVNAESDGLYFSGGPVQCSY